MPPRRTGHGAAAEFRSLARVLVDRLPVEGVLGLRRSLLEQEGGQQHECAI